jgi:hypothetical protein
MMRTILPALALFAALSASACSSDDSQPSQEDTYPGRYAHAWCAVLEPCCRANGLSFDEGRCELGGAAFGQQGVDAARAAGAVFDPDVANACIRRAALVTKTCTPLGSDPEDAVCSQVFTGTKPPGDPCTSDLDCAATAAGRGSCYRPSGSSSAQCVILRAPARVGDACAVASGPPPEELADCRASGLWCDLSATCANPVAIGEPCGPLTRCVDGAYCDPSGACATALAQGASCVSNGDCESGLCLRGACAANGAGSLAPCTGQTQ